MRTSPCRSSTEPSSPGPPPAAGSAFPSSPFRFSVHSVFPSAMNLDASHDPFLLSLVADATKLHPRAAAVPGARFDEWGLAPGDRGSFDGTALRFDRPGSPIASIGGPRSAPERAPRAPSLAGLPDAERLLFAAREEAGLPPRLGTEGGEPWTDRLASVASRLGPAFGSGDAGMAAGAALALAGLGPGLTPAGDDFLVGWLCARWSMADEKGEAFLDAAGGAIVAGILAPPPVTNRISAAFVAGAARGRFAAALLAFARSLCEAGESGIAASIRGLRAIGHGSGLDAASGFLFGITGAMSAAS